MIEKIAHISDVHIRTNPSRNSEYRFVFNNLYDSLNQEKPDRIVISGDLVNDFLDLQSEQIILVSEFLNNLSKIAPVRIVRGNHDFRKKHLKRIDSVDAIVRTMNNNNIIYYGETNFFDDDNVTWCVWHHGEQNNNPWNRHKKYQRKEHQTHIDLFHDPINGCKTTTNFEMKHDGYYNLSDFKGDYSFFGDIHKMQLWGSKGYAGSLIAQDFSEGDDKFHGYLLWNISNGAIKEITIENSISYNNVIIDESFDSNKIDFKLKNPAEFVNLRFVWKCLPEHKSREVERKLVEYFKNNYNVIQIKNKVEFINVDEINVDKSIDLNTINIQQNQQEIFKVFLKNVGCNDKTIIDVLNLDDIISKEIVNDIINNIEWDIIRFGCKNFKSYEEFDINWNELDGIYQIHGENAAGKTTILNLITYVLFGKTLETENKVKFGDVRYINNKNGATFCEGYVIIRVNNEFYGIKRKTNIETNKRGEITATPTTLNYYKLNSINDNLSDEILLNKLDDEGRVRTQALVDGVIGSYDNFMKIIMTTSDTLNRVLSNDMAVFIDSLLYDCGLDIFDKKLTVFKEHQKRINEKSRINCNVEKTKEEITNISNDVIIDEKNIETIRNVELVDVLNKKIIGNNFIEDLTKKLNKIDSNILSTNVDLLKTENSDYQFKIGELNEQKTRLTQSMVELKEFYDEEGLNNLILNKDEHKQKIYDLRLDIKNKESEIITKKHEIEIINGKIFNIRKNNDRNKVEIENLLKSKICPTCNQEILDEKHKTHIKNKIDELTLDIKKNDSEVINYNTINITQINKEIGGIEDNINEIKENIVSIELKMDDILNRIGVLTNDKNDVEKRREIYNKVNEIPTKIENFELRISINNKKIELYNNSLKQIEENNSINKKILAGKNRLDELTNLEKDCNDKILRISVLIEEKKLKIKNFEKNLIDFAEQEYRDNVMNLYKKCIHRDGIPKQLLSTHIIPTINLYLEKSLSSAPFKVWLDVDDLRPKLAYNEHPTTIIDCIGASGKERTFSSIVLKFALNQINVKSKPSILLMDEIMGKLSKNGVEEFIEILNIIKEKIRKIIIIEHNHEINPDYIIQVNIDENRISTLNIE